MEYNLMVNREKLSVQAVISKWAGISTGAGVSQGHIQAQRENRSYEAEFVNVSDHQVLIHVDGKIFNAYVSRHGNTKTVILRGRSYEITDADLMEETSSGKKSFLNTASVVASPMPAVVIGILVKIGDRVEKGQGLVIVSAMKMETTLFAPFEGRVSGIHADIGDKVMPAHILVDIEKD
jgi:3-methylcrotonyl-CoA carboxylase alpha subunit